MAPACGWCAVECISVLAQKVYAGCGSRLACGARPVCCLLKEETVCCAHSAWHNPADVLEESARLVTDPAEDLPIAGRGECFPGQAAET
eukprot:363660-Chlamydomonas_euryale.AAC.5